MFKVKCCPYCDFSPFQSNVSFLYLLKESENLKWLKSWNHSLRVTTTQPAFTCSESAVQTTEQCVKGSGCRQGGYILAALRAGLLSFIMPRGASAVLGGVFGGGDGGIQWNWSGQEKFDVYFWVFFDCYCQSLLSGGETGRWAMSPPKFEVSLIFPYLLRS